MFIVRVGWFYESAALQGNTRSAISLLFFNYDCSYNCHNFSLEQKKKNSHLLRCRNVPRGPSGVPGTWGKMNSFSRATTFIRRRSSMDHQRREFPFPVRRQTSTWIIYTWDPRSFHATRSWPCIRMDSDRIRMKFDPNVTFYHILIRIRMRMRILSDMNTKRIVRIRIRIRIPFRFET